MTGEYEILLADGWTEETPGIEARFTAAENTELPIDQVEYEVVGRRRRIQDFEADFEASIHSDDVVAEA